MKFRMHRLMNTAADAVFGAGGGGGGGGGGAAGAPAPAPGPAPAPSPAPGPAPAPAPAGQWFDGFQNTEVKTWVQGKGFKDPSAVAESAFNLEKLIGHEKAGRTLVVPKDDAPPEELKAFHAKIGVPETAEGYKLPVPEGDDGSFAKVAGGWMHEAGVPAKAAAKLAEKWNAFQADQVKATQTAQLEKAKVEFTDVMTGWGAKAEENMGFVQKAAANFIPVPPGLDDKAAGAERKAIFSKIEMAVGSHVALEIFRNMGMHMGEHTMADNGSGGSNGAMTPAAAQAQINALKSDKEWGARYLKGGTAEKAEMERLHKIAYPGT